MFKKGLLVLNYLQGLFELSVLARIISVQLEIRWGVMTKHFQGRCGKYCTVLISGVIFCGGIVKMVVPCINGLIKWPSSSRISC